MKPPNPPPEPDETLDTLLDLDGQTFYYDTGWWVKLEAKKVEQSKHRPHGVKYSLTLHDRQNNRILGYDNAHCPKTRKKAGFRGRRIVYDHKHMERKTFPYHFESSARLIEDFFKEVDEIMALQP